MIRTPGIVLASVAVSASVSCTRPAANGARVQPAACECNPERQQTDGLVPTGWVRQVSDARALQVAISGEHFNSKRSKPLRVTVSNPSLQGRLWVNRSIQIAPDWIPSPLRVRIRHAITGELLAPSCTAHFLPDSEYTEIGPGGAYSQLVSLACVAFPSCGPWLIQATYHDAVKELPKPPPHVEWFSGTAVSNTIEVVLDKLPYPPFAQCPNDEPDPSEASPGAGTAGEPQP